MNQTVTLPAQSEPGVLLQRQTQPLTQTLGPVPFYQTKSLTHTPVSSPLPNPKSIPNQPVAPSRGEHFPGILEMFHPENKLLFARLTLYLIKLAPEG